MGIQIGGVWELRPTGSDRNSGVYYPNVAGAGVDYSQQDDPQLIVTDLACATNGPFPQIVTSVTGGFTADMVGNGLAIAGSSGGGIGSHFRGNIFPIVAFIDTNTIQVDQSLWLQAIINAPLGTGGYARVGGARKLFSMAMGSVNSASPSPYGANDVEAEMGGNDVVWVKSGTYIDTQTDTGGGLYFGRSIVEGYEITRGDGCPTSQPIIQAAVGIAYTKTPLLGISSQGPAMAFKNVVFDGNGIVDYVLDCFASEISFRNCSFINGTFCAANIGEGIFVDCEFAFSGSVKGSPWDGNPQDYDEFTAGVDVYSDKARFIGCRAHHNNGPGFYLDGGGVQMERCIVDHNQGPAVVIDSWADQTPEVLNACTFDRNGWGGIVGTDSRGDSTDNGVLDNLTVLNCAFTNNCADGGYAINSLNADYTADGPEAWKSRVTKCAFYNNSGRNFNRCPAPDDMITLTAEPWADASTGDYTRNDAAGGGSLLKGAAV